MKLSEIRRILSERELQLTRSLGQNFLHDEHQLERIVRTAELRSGDRVLEIGPGLGPLTSRVLGMDAHVLAIEKDRRLFEYLQSRFGADRRADLIHADALDFLRQSRRDWNGWKLVSNLPYAVASPILVELAIGPNPPESMTVTIQSEVAERLAAEPGGKEYGVLTVLVQNAYTPGPGFRIPRGCFFPVPGVDSTCLRLNGRATPVVPSNHIETFARIVKRGFSQRRKMMLKLLKAEWPEAQLKSAFSEIGIPGDIRAERVTVEQFARLTLAISNEGGRNP